MTDAKPSTDWERIEVQYRTGVMTLREIASMHGISEGAIRKRAKRDDWPRDLEAKVQAKAAELVRKAEVRSGYAEGSAAYQAKQEVAIQAQVVSEVMLRHKSTIRRLREVAEGVLTEIEAQTGNPQLFAELGEFLRSEDEGAQDKRQDVYQRAISTASRIDGLKKLADTLKVLVGLEREAYGIQPLPQQVNLNAKVSKVDDLTDEELLAISTGGRPGAADTPESEG